MADQSLIDFQGAAQLGMMQRHLDLQQGRNEIYEENSLLKKQQLDEEVKAREQRLLFKQMDYGTKVIDDSTASLDYKAKVYQFIADKAGFPDLDSNDLLSAGTTLRNISDAFRKGDQAGLDEHTMALGAQFPKMALDHIALLERTQGLSEKAAEFKQRLQLNQGKLDAMQQKNAALAVADADYRPALDEFKSHLSSFGERGPGLYEQKKTAREAVIAMNPDLKRIVDESKSRQEMANRFGLEAQKDLAYWKEQQRAVDEGTSSQSREAISEHIIGAQNLVKARAAQSKWLGNLSQDDWDKSTYRDFLTAQRSLTESARTTTKGLKSIADDFRSFARDKFDAKTAYNSAIGDAQSEVLSRFGRTPQPSELSAIATKHGVQPAEILPGLADPAQKGKMDVSMNLAPAVKADAQKDAIALKPLLATIQDMRDIVTKHPETVGATGSAIRFIGGLAQQTRAAFNATHEAFANDPNIDPSARAKLNKMFEDKRKRFNTKHADDLESYSIGLTYKLARALSGSGVLSDTDVARADTLASPLRGRMGSDQFLNHLNVIELEALRHAQNSSEALQRGTAPIIKGGQKPPENAAEFLKEKFGIGATP